MLWSLPTGRTNIYLVHTIGVYFKLAFLVAWTEQPLVVNFDLISSRWNQAGILQDCSDAKTEV